MQTLNAPLQVKNYKASGFAKLFSGIFNYVDNTMDHDIDKQMLANFKPLLKLGAEMENFCLVLPNYAHLYRATHLFNSLGYSLNFRSTVSFPLYLSLESITRTDITVDTKQPQPFVKSLSLEDALSRFTQVVNQMNMTGLEPYQEPA